jgi:hypothetical protein
MFQISVLILLLSHLCLKTKLTNFLRIVFWFYKIFTMFKTLLLILIYCIHFLFNNVHRKRGHKLVYLHSANQYLCVNVASNRNRSGVRRHQADRGAFVSVAGNQSQSKAGRAARRLSSLSLCSRLRKRRPRRHTAERSPICPGKP